MCILAIYLLQLPATKLRNHRVDLKMRNTTVQVTLVKYVSYIVFVPLCIFISPTQCQLLSCLYNRAATVPAYHYFNSATGAFKSTCGHSPSVTN